MQKTHNNGKIRVLDHPAPAPASSPQSTTTANSGGVPACASCRHQRKKCRQNCLLAPFFPAEKSQDFQSVHKVFGVSNVTKLVKDLSREDAIKAVNSLIWEANCRLNDPVLGPLGEFQRVCEELKFYKSQYQVANIHHNLRQVPIIQAQQRLIGSWNGDHNNAINNGSMLDYINSKGIAGDIDNSHINFGSLQNMEKIKQERDQQQQRSLFHPQHQLMNDFTQFY